MNKQIKQAKISKYIKGKNSQWWNGSSSSDSCSLEEE